MPNDLLEQLSPSGDGPHYDEDMNELNRSEKVEETEETDEEEEVDSAEEPLEDLEVDEIEEEEKELEPSIFARPSIREIKEKYPNIFKDFPNLKDAFFREIEFTKVFPTVEEAKEAITEVQAFQAMSEAALNGDSEPILESLGKTDEKALKAFACSFLPALYKKNSEVYSLAVTPLFENFLRQAYRGGDENMKNSAINLAVFLFGEEGEESVQGKKTISKVVQITEEQKRLKQESDNRIAGAFRDAAADVSIRVRKSMKALVAKDFDPNEVFTPFIRGKLVDEVVSKIDENLRSDKAHETIMGARWNKAKSSGYSSEEKSKLISTYLARAKSLIPRIKEEVRRAALGKTSEDAKIRANKARNAQAPRETVGGRPPNSGKNGSTSKVDYSKMTDAEILAS